MTRVAVLGTGRMGSAMARALTAAGHDLVVYNRTEERARRLAMEVRADVAATPADAVRAAEAAITILADRMAVDETYRREGGVLDGVHDGLVVLEMSTVEPDVSRSLDPVVRAAGGVILDAPVSGSIALAEQGQLTVMVGGEREVLERAAPILDAVAARVFHVGPIGSGAVMKLAVNAVIFGLDVALAEALVLAERAGVDRATAYDVLQASAAGAPFVGYKRGAFLEPDSTPTAFAFELAEKDLRLITALADAVGVPVAQARANLDVIRSAAASEGPDRDFALVAEHLRARPVIAGGGKAEAR